jgi:hypothetical protein
MELNLKFIVRLIVNLLPIFIVIIYGLNYIISNVIFPFIYPADSETIAEITQNHSSHHRYWSAEICYRFKYNEKKYSNCWYYKRSEYPDITYPDLLNINSENVNINYILRVPSTATVMFSKKSPSKNNRLKSKY